MTRDEAALHGQSKNSEAASSGEGESDASKLLDRSRRLLESLTLKAEAARAEAEKAQLQFLVAQAEAGDCKPLQAWFDGHALKQHALEQNEEPEAAAASAEEVSGPVAEPKSAADGRGQSADSRSHVGGWDSEQGRAWIAASRARLGLAESAPGSAESGSAASDHGGRDAGDKLRHDLRDSVESRASASSSQKRAESELRRSEGAIAKKAPDPKSAASRPASPSPTANAASPNSKASVAKASGSNAEVSDKPRVRREVLAAVSDVLGDEQTEASGTKRSKLAGIAASVIVHLLLLVLLAVITLKLPTDGAGLALQSVSSPESETVMEVVQEVSTEVPQSSESDSVVEPVVDAADSFSGIQADVADSLGQVEMQTPAAAASSIMSATSSASSMPSGEAASFFGAAAGGNNFCYVIDASGSMRGGPWQAAKFELLKSLASLQPNQRYYIICFNRELSPMVLDGPGPEPSSVYATPENLQKTRRWIETIEIGIGAPPNKALEYAIELEPDAVYFLSDGVTKVDVAAFLRGVNQVESLFGESQVRVPIHPIAYYSLEGQSLLRQIAAENAGQFIYVPDPTK
ncbi:MAG: hypothetical protein Aurels2KO_17590 [Aureliella sp.]